jgi:hypothetical protein
MKTLGEKKTCTPIFHQYFQNISKDVKFDYQKVHLFADRDWLDRHYHLEKV